MRYRVGDFIIFKVAQSCHPSISATSEYKTLSCGLIGSIQSTEDINGKRSHYVVQNTYVEDADVISKMVTETNE